MLVVTLILATLHCAFVTVKLDILWNKI